MPDGALLFRVLRVSLGLAVFDFLLNFRSKCGRAAAEGKLERSGY